MGVGGLSSTEFREAFWTWRTATSDNRVLQQGKHSKKAQEVTECPAGTWLCPQNPDQKLGCHWVLPTWNEL